jgi:hypothetical protein
MTKHRVEHFTETLAKGELSSLDFMMMDVQRPLTNDEINEINPQAALDKTIGSGEEVDGDAEDMGGAPSRCLTCFAPMPCVDHANVEHLNVVTTHDIEPTTILADAHGAGLKEVVIVGVLRDGTEYFASSVSDAAPAMYHLQRGIYKLNRTVDGGEGTNEHPDAA